MAKQRRLADNLNHYDANRHGAPRQGNALLQGIAVCGRCGRRMGLHYSGPNGNYPVYLCRADQHQHGGPRCQEVHRRQRCRRPRPHRPLRLRVKGSEAMLSKALAGARGRLTTMVTDLSNQIRGIIKTFDLVVPKGSGGVFERNVRALLDGAEAIGAVVTPLLDVWRLARQRAAALDRRLPLRHARAQSVDCS